MFSPDQIKWKISSDRSKFKRLSDKQAKESASGRFTNKESYEIKLKHTSEGDANITSSF